MALACCGTVVTACTTYSGKFSHVEDEVGGTCGTNDNIKIDLLEIGLGVVEWIGVAQDRYRWRALVNSVMNLQVP
jgi:hypothetical protein